MCFVVFFICVLVVIFVIVYDSLFFFIGEEVLEYSYIGEEIWDLLFFEVEVVVDIMVQGNIWCICVNGYLIKKLGIFFNCNNLYVIFKKNYNFKVLFNFCKNSCFINV